MQQVDQLKNENGFEQGRKVKFFVTAKGSIYSYLNDGRTERIKAVENKKYDPMDAIVFLPDYAWVEKNARPGMLSVLGENEAQYEQCLLSYVQGAGKKTFIVDSAGHKLETNEQIATVQCPIFVAFGDEEKIEFTVPASRTPKVGYFPYDTTKYRDTDGKLQRRSHIGNKIIQIEEE